MSKIDIYEKLENLKMQLLSYKKVVVAFSGGVDSTFLLQVAKDVLGDNVIAVTANSIAHPKRELSHSCDFTKEIKVKHIVFDSKEFDLEGFTDNPPNRCYICKMALFKDIIEIGKSQNTEYIIEGSNLDDESDYRPGAVALKELGILSPLKKADLTKNEIRILSGEMGLSTFNKPSFACLYTRFPYGDKLTREKLNMVDMAEQLLIDMGIEQVRVRHHGDVARIELPEESMNILLDKNNRTKVDLVLKEIGFSYVSLDLKGYRTGSMNETLKT